MKDKIKSELSYEHIRNQIALTVYSNAYLKMKEDFDWYLDENKNRFEVSNTKFSRNLIVDTLNKVTA